MRGRDQSSGNLFSSVDLEERVPDDHPLRLIREIVNDVLGSLSSEFETLYSHMGRPLRIPTKAATDSDPKRPLWPGGEFGVVIVAVGCSLDVIFVRRGQGRWR